MHTGQKFVNDKVKEWDDFLFQVEDLIQNFSSFSNKQQEDIIHYIFDGIVIKDGKIELIRMNDVFLFLMLLLTNSSIDLVGGYLKFDEFLEWGANLSNSIKEPSLTPLLCFISTGRPLDKVIQLYRQCWHRLAITLVQMQKTSSKYGATTQNSQNYAYKPPSIPHRIGL